MHWRFEAWFAMPVHVQGNAMHLRVLPPTRQLVSATHLLCLPRLSQLIGLPSWLVCCIGRRSWPRCRCSNIAYRDDPSDLAQEFGEQCRLRPAYSNCRLALQSRT